MLATAEHRVRLRAGRDVARDAAAIDDVDRVAFDVVARPARHALDRGIERDERPQRAVGEAVARRTGREDFLHDRHEQQRFVGARDADGHGLGLMLDRVDRAGELVDGFRERGVQVLDHRARCSHLAELDLVRVQVLETGRIAQHRGDAHGGGRLEASVVVARPQLVEEPRGMRFERGCERAERIEAVARGRERGLDATAGLPQWSCRRVDGQRGLVSEEMPGHRAEDEREIGVHHGNRDRVDRGGETVFAVVDDCDRGRLVRPVDRDLLGDVVGVGTTQTGRTHEDHRLGREIDVLLVLGDVTRDRLVAQLRELDANLVCGNAIQTVADDGP